MRTQLFCLLVVTLQPALVLADADVEPATVRGANIQSFVYDPNDSDTVYAADAGAGLYKSTDDGSNWTQLILPTVSAHFVRAILPSQATADLVLVGDGSPSEAAVWRSVDGGANWTNVIPAVSGACTALAEGTTAGTYYAGVVSSSGTPTVYKSTDSGQTWTALAGTLPASHHVSALVQLSGGRLVAGARSGTSSNGTSGGLYYSDNDGASWSLVTGGSTAAPRALLRASDVVVASVSDGSTLTVRTSADGIDFSNAAGTFVGTDIGGGRIAYHAGDDVLILTTGDDKVFFSGDGSVGYSFGGSPTAISDGLTSPVILATNHLSGIAIDPDNSAKILVAEQEGGEGVFATTDAGANWSISNAGLRSQVIDHATKAPNGYRYVGNRSGFVYFSDGDLSAFKKIFRPTDVTQDPVTTLAYDTADPAHIVVARSNLNDNHRIDSLSDAVAASEDASPFAHTGWTTLTDPTSDGPVFALLVDGLTLYAGVSVKDETSSGQFLYKSTNGGSSWSALSLTTVGGVRALAFDPNDHQIIYAGSGSFSGVGYTPSKPVPAADGIYKTTDGGTTWVHLDSDADLNSQSPRTIVVDPNNTSRIFLLADHSSGGGNTNNDIFESTDGGATWAKVTPSGGASRFAFTYSASEDLLFLSGGGSTDNVIAKRPGDGPEGWVGAFSVYGEAQVLYPGSVGCGSATGLFEASNVTVDLPDDGTTDPPPGDGGDVGDEGGGGGKGCGCHIGAQTVMPAGAGVFLLALLALARRRRGAVHSRGDL